MAAPKKKRPGRRRSGQRLTPLLLFATFGLGVFSIISCRLLSGRFISSVASEAWFRPPWAALLPLRPACPWPNQPLLLSLLFALGPTRLGRFLLLFTANQPSSLSSWHRACSSQTSWPPSWHHACSARLRGRLLRTTLVPARLRGRLLRTTLVPARLRGLFLGATRIHSAASSPSAASGSAEAQQNESQSKNQ